MSLVRRFECRWFEEMAALRLSGAVTGPSAALPHGCASLDRSVPLEILHGPLVLLGRRARLEGAEIAALARLGI
jgi:hypothetical protein